MKKQVELIIYSAVVMIRSDQVAWKGKIRAKK